MGWAPRGRVVDESARGHGLGGTLVRHGSHGTGPSPGCYKGEEAPSTRGACLFPRWELVTTAQLDDALPSDVRRIGQRGPLARGRWSSRRERAAVRRARRPGFASTGAPSLLRALARLEIEARARRRGPGAPVGPIAPHDAPVLGFSLEPLGQRPHEDTAD